MTNYPFLLGHGAAEAEQHYRACLIQRAALIHAETYGYLDEIPFDVVFTDSPCWLNAAISDIAVRCNDRYGIEAEYERQALQEFLPRILAAVKHAEAVEVRINYRISSRIAKRLLEHLSQLPAKNVFARIVETLDRHFDRFAEHDQDCEEWERKYLRTLMQKISPHQLSADSGQPVDGLYPQIWQIFWALLHGSTMGSTAQSMIDMLAGKPEYEDPADELADALDVYDKACAEEGVVNDDEAAKAAVEELRRQYEHHEFDDEDDQA